MDWTEVVIEVNAGDVDAAGDIAQMVVDGYKRQQQWYPARR